jgi:hypothetical protein
MSKKKFSDGLDSIFSDIHEEVMATTYVLRDSPKADAEERSAKMERKGGKNFSSNMDDVIMKSFVTNNENQNKEEDDNSNIRYSHVKKQRTPLTGIDGLFSRSIEYGDLDNDVKKRIVLILENQKVDKLKAIAKKEHLFLKDVIVQSVSSYIERYERGK